MTTTPTTSGAPDLPEALRSIQRFEVVDCVDDKHVPAVIPKPHGQWVRYEDHVTALAAGQAVVQDDVVALVRAAQAFVLEPDSHKKKLELEAMAWGPLAAGQATAAQQVVAYAALPAPNYPKSGGFPGTFAEAQMRAFADATHALRASHGQAPAQPDPAYSEACNLATALFKKHFAHLPDFASGQAVWGLCGSTAGVISQIDNMVSGLVQPPTTAFSEDELE